MSSVYYPKDYIATKIFLCLVNFDFEKAAKCLETDVDKLEKLAEDLLCDSFKWLVDRNEREQSITSAGLKASWNLFNDGTADCELECIVAGADSYTGGLDEKLPALPAPTGMCPSCAGEGSRSVTPDAR